MKYSLCLAASFVIAQQSLAQSVDSLHKAQKQTPIYRAVEQMPEAGYDVNMFIAKNINYPPDARDAGVTGRVTVEFVVDSTGNIDNIAILGSHRLGYGLEEEAIRLVKLMPAWKPGKQNGQPVSVKYTIPISFKINSRPSKL